MRAPRYRFPDEVRTATRGMASRMLAESTVAETPEQLEAWLSEAPDEASFPRCPRLAAGPAVRPVQQGTDLHGAELRHHPIHARPARRAGGDPEVAAMSKRSILTVAAFAGVFGLAACGGDDAADEPAFETVDPYATDPAATTAPPAEMEMDTMGMDTMMMDTMRR